MAQDDVLSYAGCLSGTERRRAKWLPKATCLELMPFSVTFIILLGDMPSSHASRVCWQDVQATGSSLLDHLPCMQVADCSGC